MSKYTRFSTKNRFNHFIGGIVGLLDNCIKILSFGFITSSFQYYWIKSRLF